jgi:hypothetical protein
MLLGQGHCTPHGAVIDEYEAMVELCYKPTYTIKMFGNEEVEKTFE